MTELRLETLLDRLFHELTNPQLQSLGTDMMFETIDHFRNGRVIPGVISRFVGLLAGMELERRSTAEGIGGTKID